MIKGSTRSSGSISSAQFKIAKRLLLTAFASLLFGFWPSGSSMHFQPFCLLQAQAQNFSQRTIQGKVVDDTETPVAEATVFLKDVKSRSIKSFTSTADGSFRFAQVGMVDDYEVWAEHNKKKSPTKTISSFDSRKQVDFDLKLK